MCGLKSGPGGAKATFKVNYATAFREESNLKAIRDLGLSNMNLGDEVHARERCVAIVDANVVLMSVPESCGTIDAYTRIVFDYVRDVCAASEVAAFVFDEPEHMTLAKREEQQKRDAARRSRQPTTSSDLNPINPAFTIAELNGLPNVHLLKSNRRARVRLYDEVMRRVYERMKTIFAQWSTSGFTPGVLILDGVDILGAQRPGTEPRVPGMVGNDEAILSVLARTEGIGEGDIKLMDVEARLRAHTAVDTDFAKHKLCLTVTTDTDTFCCLITDVAKRRVNPTTGSMKTLFVMREPATKRDRQDDPFAGAKWLGCDTTLLEGLLQQHLWSRTSHEGRDATPVMLLSSMLAFTACAALCGCDFTVDGLRGARLDHFFEVLPQFISEYPDVLVPFQNVLQNDAVLARAACSSLERITHAASDHMQNKPRYRKQALSVRSVTPELLQRSIWSAAYWGLQEFRDVIDWGFNPPSPVSSSPPAPASPLEPEPERPCSPVTGPLVTSKHFGGEA